MWAWVWIRVAIAAVLTPAVKGIASLVDVAMPWWLAAVIALVLVFLGQVVIVVVDGAAD